MHLVWSSFIFFHGEERNILQPFATATLNHFVEKAGSISPSRGGMIYPLQKESAVVVGRRSMSIFSKPPGSWRLRATAASSSRPCRRWSGRCLMYRPGEAMVRGDRAGVRTTGRRSSPPPAGAPSRHEMHWEQLAWDAISSPANAARPIPQRSSISRTLVRLPSNSLLYIQPIGNILSSAVVLARSHTSINLSSRLLPPPPPPVQPFQSSIVWLLPRFLFI